MITNAKKWIYTVGLTAGVTAVAAGLGGCTPNIKIPDTLKVQNMDASNNTITVTGMEEVKVAPDMARIEYAVYTQENTAAECQEKNSKDLQAAIDALKGLGIEEKSIQTSSFGLNPIYDWKSERQEITGYEMTTRLTVSDIPIEEAGKVISQSVTAGVNGIDSVSYFCSNYDASYQEALKGAMSIAEAKAKALAEASGKSLAGVVHVEEFGYNPDVRYSNNTSGPGMRADKESGAAVADMAVMAGEVIVEAQVTVDYQLN